MVHRILPITLSLAAIGLFCVAGVHASEADERLQSSFVASHVYKTYLKDDASTFAAKDGIVTLSGTVVDPAHRMLAEEMAAGMTGVQKVDNRITTSGTETANSDIWIGRKISMALLFHSNVNAGRTTVAVRSGVVTLTGTAISEAQRDLTTAYAKDIDGVTEVKNEMVVVAGPAAPERSAGEKIDDASIAAQVHTALMTHRSTASATTKITARDGEVTITGIATNAAEKILVTKLATGIDGVSGVKNLMTIGETVRK